MTRHISIEQLYQRIEQDLLTNPRHLEAYVQSLHEREARLCAVPSAGKGFRMLWALLYCRAPLRELHAPLRQALRLLHADVCHWAPLRLPTVRCQTPRMTPPLPRGESTPSCTPPPGGPDPWVGDEDDDVRRAFQTHREIDAARHCAVALLLSSNDFPPVIRDLLQRAADERTGGPDERVSYVMTVMNIARGLPVSASIRAWVRRYLVPTV